MSTPRWQSYEDIARYILQQMAAEFGLERVEGKQLIQGRSGTTWEIDGKGVSIDDSAAFIIIECRRYTTSKQKQEQIAALAYRIQDTGAAGGIIVSPLGLQEGAERVAQAERIASVRLDKDSTPEQYLLHFLGKVFRGMGLYDTVTVTDQLIVHVEPAPQEDS